MFKLRYPAIALASALFGAFAAIGIYMYYVPLPTDAMARGEALGADRRPWLHGAMAEVFPTRAVEAAPDAAALPVVEGALEGFTFTHDGTTKTIEDLYADQAMLGIVVLKDGAIVHESYAPGHGPGTLFTTWSVVKSFTSTLVGMALQDGLIGSVDDALSRYIPEVSGTAYEGVTIRQALEMSSGVAFDVGSGDDTVAFVTDGPITGKRAALDIALSHSRQSAPGSAFNYNTAETQLLVELVRRVTGGTAADYMAERLWQPLGMRYNGAWVLDAPGADGAEIGGAMFNAALRDWARFGWFIAQDGVWEGERLLPEGWVTDATVTTQAHLMPGDIHPDPTLGYGWQWWTRADGTFAAKGAYGQAINIDPANGLVVAKASAWTEPRVPAHDAETLAMARALAVWDYSEEGGGVLDAALDPALDAAPETGTVETVAGEPPAVPVPEIADQLPQAAPPPERAATQAEADTSAPGTRAVESDPEPAMLSAPSVKPELGSAGASEDRSASTAPVDPEDTAGNTPAPAPQAAEDRQDPEEGMGVAQSRFIDPDEE
ncbi:MAG: serine hydrolase [Pseudomonadota bacterium]